MSAEDYGGTRKRKVSRFLTELGFTTPAQAKSDRDVLTLPGPKQRTRTEVLHSVPDRISFSQIAAFSTCPLQYKYAHILKVPTFGRHSLSFGKSMHNTLQKFLEQVKERQTAAQVSLFGNEPVQRPLLPSVPELLELFDLGFIDEWYESEEEREEYRARGKESLTKFHEQILLDTPKIFGLELGFTLKVGEVLVKGRIDRIDELPDGSLEVVDYKTGNPKTKLEWDDKRQLVLYALALEQCLPDPKPVKKLTYYYLTTNETVSFEPTEKDREKLTQQILETMDRIAKSDFAADPDAMKCKYCDFKDICPAAKF
jgi:DNA helicase-2/ATP-dependent DNA helicase PcrA